MKKPGRVLTAEGWRRARLKEREVVSKPRKMTRSNTSIARVSKKRVASSAPS